MIAKLRGMKSLSALCVLLLAATLSAQPTIPLILLGDTNAEIPQPRVVLCDGCEAAIPQFSRDGEEFKELTNAGVPSSWEIRSPWYSSGLYGGSQTGNGGEEGFDWSVAKITVNQLDGDCVFNEVTEKCDDGLDCSSLVIVRYLIWAPNDFFDPPNSTLTVILPGGFSTLTPELSSDGLWFADAETTITNPCDGSSEITLLPEVAPFNQVFSITTETWGDPVTLQFACGKCPETPQ